MCATYYNTTIGINQLKRQPDLLQFIADLHIIDPHLVTTKVQRPSDSKTIAYKYVLKVEDEDIMMLQLKWQNFTIRKTS